MKAEFVNPFITAAADVLNAETKGRTSRKGNLRLDHGSETSKEVTAMVGLTGGVRGVVMLAMPEDVARKIYGAMVGEDDPELDEMAHSALGELCNMITGQAATTLANSGHHTNLTPPGLTTTRIWTWPGGWPSRISATAARSATRCGRNCSSDWIGARLRASIRPRSTACTSVARERPCRAYQS